jgi:hypothetical protein
VQARIEAQQALLEQSVTRRVRLVAATETRMKSSSVVLPDQEPKAGRSKSNHGQLLLRQEELEAGGVEKQHTSQAEPNRRTAACLWGKTREQSTLARRNRAGGAEKFWHGAARLRAKTKWREPRRTETKIRKSSGALREDSAPAAA